MTVCPSSFGVNPARNLLYAFVSDGCGSGEGFAAIASYDLASNSLASVWPQPVTAYSQSHLVVDSAADRIYAVGFTGTSILTDPTPTTVQVPADSMVAPVTVAQGAISLTFSDVTAGGQTLVQQIDPTLANLQVPGEFVIGGATAFEVSTTAGFAGPITVCFDMSAVDSPDAFGALRILHGENGAWVDRTSSRDFATGQICATTTSLSPFAVARLATHYQVRALFDQTRAFKSGSTIPVKVQLLNAAGGNASNALATVTAKSLKRISTNTSTFVQDAGQANPDSAFRFDPNLIGYVFNLSTKGLPPGTYALALKAAGDPGPHLLQFSIK